jgi:pyridinium-3,5-bisthiocarboxylic acid mononucleotide nickel chelatase
VTRLAFAEPVGGAAGDMLLSALLDAGAPFDAVAEAVEAVLPGRFVLGIEEVRRRGVRALHLTVSRSDGSRVVDADHAPRPLAELVASVEGAALPQAVRERARRVLDRLGAAEARVHGTSSEAVRLHELGNDDTLVDVVGVSAALHALRVDDLRVGLIPLGTEAPAGGGHGGLPMPGPATLELLRGFRVRDGWRGETVTPTAAAIFAGLGRSVDAFPAMTIDGVGYGAGTDDPADVPNVVRIVIGTEAASNGGDGDPPTRELSLLETNLDDLSPELVADAAEALRAAGALDAWITPVLMKKGRPGFVLSALVTGDVAEAARLVFFEHTSTFGVRSTPVQRTELERRLVRVALAEGEVRVKVGLLGGRVIRATPEHDDVAAVASRTGRPALDVYEEAAVAARSLRYSAQERP